MCAPIRRQQQARDQQHVCGEEAGDDGVPGELTAEEEERRVGAYDGDRLHEPVRGPDAGAGQQVVGQRVAGEALEGAQEEQQAADDPVQLARLAERAGEEHPEQVHDHGADEEHRRPVVHLTHQQAAAHVEGDVQRRGVRLGHLQATELVVGPLVGDLAHARLEPERQEDAGQQQDDEAPQRDLAEHEGPVVGEDLADLLLGQPGQTRALVGPVRSGADRVGLGRLGCCLGGGRAHLSLVPRSSDPPAR